MKKVLKYLVVAVLAMTMVMSLAACGADVDNSRVGMYTIDSAEAMGQTLSGDLLKANGLEGFYVELKKNGKGTVALGGQTDKITWTNTTIKEGDQEMSYSISGDILTIEVTGIKMNFKKQ